MRSTGSFRAVKAAAVAAVLVGATVAVAGPASAAEPQGACNGDAGPYVEVLQNYGTVYHVVSGPFVDDNGTSTASSSSFSNEFSGTIEASISDNFTVGGSVVAVDVSNDLGVSLSLSATVSGSHSVTYNVSPHTALHAEYAVDQKHTYDEEYTQNDVCTKSEVAEGNDYLNFGQGWHTWTTSYSG